METEEFKVGNPFILCTKLIFEILSKCIVTLTSPLFSRAPAGEGEGEPSKSKAPAASSVGMRMAVGMAAAAYVLMVLLAAMFVAAVLGVGLVSSWAEEPLYVRETLHFDYTNPHPTALFSSRNGAALVPAGHTMYVSLLLLMPDSDYNRDIGIFQLSAELISGQGNVIGRSSQPSMLRFRSWPIRYARTFFMGVPLLLGLISETQTLTFPAFKHKEAPFPRTHDIRIILIPRAGTFSLPQFYDAQLLLTSTPPWPKQLLYSWKLTFSVWTTFYLFLIFLMFIAFFLKPIIFPTPLPKSQQGHDQEQDYSAFGDNSVTRDDGDMLQRWQRTRSKRKAALLHGSVSSSASSITFDRGEGCPSLDQDSTGDSESVCC